MRSIVTPKTLHDTTLFLCSLRVAEFGVSPSRPPSKEGGTTQIAQHIPAALTRPSSQVMPGNDWRWSFLLRLCDAISFAAAAQAAGVTPEIAYAARDVRSTHQEGA